MGVTHSFTTTCLTFLPTRPRCGATRTRGSTIFVKGGARAGQGRCGPGAPWRPPKQYARPSPSQPPASRKGPPVSASSWGSPGLGHLDGVPPTSASSWGLPGSQRPREVPSRPSYGIHRGHPVPGPGASRHLPEPVHRVGAGLQVGTPRKCPYGPPDTREGAAAPPLHAAWPKTWVERGISVLPPACRITL